MSTFSETIIERSSRPPAEQRIIMQNVSWETYESLLRDLADQGSVRLTYDRGTLEIMSPQSEHERIKHIIELMVELVGIELKIDIECFGSTTFKRADLARGFEPDSSFYIKQEANISDKTNIDLSTEPPPDLVVEVDITSPSLAKFPLYAKIGIPEVWLYDGRKLTFHKLSADTYLEINSSLAFPFINSQDFTDFIEKSRTWKKTALLQSFSEWLKRSAHE
jgi:Uma2 family endonuclease